MAFQNYKPGKSIFDQIWVGLDQFKFLFSDDVFLKVLRNTLAMSLINLSLGFICSIGLALILNEVRNRHAKKFVQTVSYLPHFLSWIVVTGIVAEVLSPSTGVVNEILQNMNLVDNPINFFADPKYFWGIVGATNVWKEVGWGSIIYLAAMTSINPDLYEAAEIDGAGRLQKIWHVTLPGIKPTIFILLIINIGNILNAGFDITRKYGINKVSNRELAKYLNCSIRPIYYQFKNSDELFNELCKKIHDYFYSYILNNLNDKIPKYKQVGLNYIKFAREEKNFYQVLFRCCFGA